MSAEKAAQALAADVEGASVVEFRDEQTLIVPRFREGGVEKMP